MQSVYRNTTHSRIFKNLNIPASKFMQKLPQQLIYANLSHHCNTLYATELSTDKLSVPVHFYNK